MYNSATLLLPPVNGANGQDGDVLLVGDTRNGYGAVLLRNFRTIFIGICPDDGTFDTTEANIVCRQLGYASGSVIQYRLVLQLYKLVAMYAYYMYISYNQLGCGCTYSLRVWRMASGGLNIHVYCPLIQVASLFFLRCNSSKFGAIQL